MLSSIKNLINNKMALQESADAIMEGSTGMDLDDMIVLGEENDLSGNIPFEEDEDNVDTTDDTESPEPENDDDGETEEPGNSEPESIPGEGNDEEDISDPLNDTVDDLPTPVGQQTGEPVENDIEDILKMEIDLKSNTMSNVLPVPPANAGEAIASDEMESQVVDSGFGESTESGKCSKTVKEHKKELADLLDDYDVKVFEDKELGGVSVKIFDKADKNLDKIKDAVKKYAEDNGMTTSEHTDDSKVYINLKCSESKAVSESAITEGISLAGGIEGETDSTGDPAPVDDTGAADTGTTDTAPDTENTVTAAVRDKVNEADSTDDTTTPAASLSKEELLGKLGDFTKRLEDLKKAVLDTSM